MAGLRGVRVVVVGGGLAGLTAAAELSQRGVHVNLLEARERLGGRVWTQHDADTGLHVEAGGEFIDADQRAIRALARSLHLPLARVLPGGFGLALDLAGRIRLRRSTREAWRAIARQLAPAMAAYRDAGNAAESPAGRSIAARSLADALAGAAPATQAMARTMRGLYLAEPEDLSALVAVEELVARRATAPAMFRIRGGADRLVQALAARLRGRILAGCVVRGVRQTRSGVRVQFDDQGTASALRADYVVITIPPPLVLDCRFDPPLPDAQRLALSSLPLGAATKVSLRFAAPWWRRPGRRRAYSTNLPVGAVWEGADDQPGAAVLTCLAGASSSATLRGRLEARGADGVTTGLTWLGRPRPAWIVGSAVTWERDPWARGGYAVYTPRFDPRLRPWLAASHGRIVFAGEHTSEDWQGFMNGAVESGQRAAADLDSLHAAAGAGFPP